MMEARDFIYHFTDKLFSEIDKSTILIENWEEKDFDFRYIEFVNIFLKMKASNQDCTDDEILTKLEKSKKIVVKDFNDKMHAKFVNEFNKNKLNSAVFAQFATTSHLFAEDTIKTDCLESFRRYEEEIFRQKTKTEV